MTIDNRKSNYIYGIHSVKSFLNSSPKTIKKIYIKKTDNKNLRNIIKIALDNKLRVIESTNTYLSTISMTNKHQGIVCEIMTSDHTNFKIDSYIQYMENPFIVILDNIQDPRNLGSCIRTANAAGVSLIIKKKSNSSGLSPVVHKSASGGLQGIHFLETNNIATIIKKLKNNNIRIIGTDHKSKKNIYKLKKTNNNGVAVILGSEGDGISKSLLDMCDEILSIPIYGSVECLNVSVAAGIILFEVASKLKKTK